MIPQYLLPEHDLTVPLDNYYRFPAALDDGLIELAKQIGNAQTLGDGVAGGVVDKNYRSARVGWIYRSNTSQWLYETIARLVQNANQNMWNFDIHSLTESIQFAAYKAEDKGHYGMHMDLGSNMPNRKLSVCILLDEQGVDFEGGDFEFQTGKDPFPPMFKKGDVIVFPSYMLHRVLPVTSGVRHSLVTWVHGPVLK